MVGKSRGATVLAAWLSLAFVACATPIGVARVDPATIQRSLATSAVADAKPGDATRTVLEEEGLIDRFEDDPAEVLRILELHASTQEKRNAN